MNAIPLLSVVMPAYNEEANIAKVLADHCRVLQGLGAVADSWEIVVVDDASTDNTWSVLQSLQSRMSRLRIVRNETNLGIFGAFARCHAEALGTHIYSTGSDGQWPAENLEPMLKALTTRGAGLVIGTRTNRNQVYGLARRIVSFSFNAIAKSLFGVDVRDAGSVKVGVRQVFNLDLISRSPFIEAERIIQAHHRGIRVEFVGIEFLVRGGGKAKGASWKNIRTSLRDVVLCVGKYGLGSRRRAEPFQVCESDHDNS